MAITVDYSSTPFLITIPKSDLTLESGTKYALDVDVFWQLLRDYADSAEGIVQPVIYLRIAATASTPSITEVNAGYYSLQFEDGSYSVNIINGNTNIRDVEIKNTVSVNTNNTTGFIDPVFLEFSTFDGSVTVQEVGGAAGTDYPLGTPSSPVDNWVDAEAIATTRGLKQFTILGDSTLTGALDFSDGHIFKGFSPVSVALTVDTSVNVLDCEFMDATINGTLDGNSVFRECVVNTVNYINGFIDHCALYGTITLGGGADASIHGCFQQKASVEPIIDMGGTGQAVSLVDFGGHIKFINNSGASTNLISGDCTLTLDSTITGGTFELQGNVRLVDNSSGTTVLRHTASALVWDESRALTVGKFIGLK